VVLNLPDRGDFPQILRRHHRQADRFMHLGRPELKPRATMNRSLGGVPPVDPRMVPQFSGNNNWIKLCHPPPFKFAIPVKEKGDWAAGLIEFPPCSRAVLTDYVPVTLAE
jgi:hypothetical protein